MKLASEELKANLFFLTSFLNKKFAYFLPNYQEAYSLIQAIFPNQPLVTSSFYAQFIPPEKQKLFQISTAGADFNLQSTFLPPQGVAILDHFAGNPAKIDDFQQPFIEDISLSLGSQWQGKNCGSFGHLTLLQLGPNLSLYFNPPNLQLAESVKKYLHFSKYPVLVLTKRFQLRQKIELILKKAGFFSLPANQLLPQVEKIGRFIQNLPTYRHKNYLSIHHLYLKEKGVKNKQLPLIHQFAQPFFTFLPYLGTKTK